MIIKRRTNVYDFNFHLIWVTKYRKSIFDTDTKRKNMKNILENIAKRYDITIQNIEILPDHIHLLISFPPDYTPSSVVKSFKGGSARNWFSMFPQDKNKLWKGHLWSPSFFMSTLGAMSKETIQKYIDSQLTDYKGKL